MYEENHEISHLKEERGTYDGHFVARLYELEAGEYLVAAFHPQTKKTEKIRFIRGGMAAAKAVLEVTFTTLEACEKLMHGGRDD